MVAGVVGAHGQSVVAPAVRPSVKSVRAAAAIRHR